MHARINGQLFAVAVQGEQLTKAQLLTSRGRLAILGEHVEAFNLADIQDLIPHIRKLFVSHTRCYNWEHLSRADRLREVSAYVTAGVFLNLTAHPELVEVALPASARIEGVAPNLKSALINGQEGAQVVESLSAGVRLRELRCVNFFPTGSFSGSLEILDVSMTRYEGVMIDAPGLREVELTNVSNVHSLDFLVRANVQRLTIENCEVFDVARAQAASSLPEALAIGSYAGRWATGSRRSRLTKGAMCSSFE